MGKKTFSATTHAKLSCVDTMSIWRMMFTEDWFVWFWIEQQDDYLLCFQVKGEKIDSHLVFKDKDIKFHIIVLFYLYSLSDINLILTMNTHQNQ